MKVIISDMAGRASVELKGRELGIDVTSDRAVAGRVAAQVKDMEARGYTFESADASFELLLRTALGEQHKYFTVTSWRGTGERGADGVVTSQATVKVTVQGSTVVAAGEGDSPVLALENALRAALDRTYPQLASLTRTEYLARVLEAPSGASTITRVVLECGDADCVWNTVGVDKDSRAARADHQQHLPRRRRQYASHHPVRRAQAGRTGTRSRGGGRDSQVLRGSRRLDHRRARRRHGKERAHGQAVPAGNAGHDGAVEAVVRSAGPAQPGQDAAHRPRLSGDSARAASVLSEKYVCKVAQPCRESNPHQRSIRRAWDFHSADPNSRAWPSPTRSRRCDCLDGHSAR